MGRVRTWTASAFVGAVVLCVSFVSLGECTTTSPPTPCSAHKDCSTCAPDVRCLWCFTTNNCTDYPVSWLLPPHSVCKLSEARWGACWLNFQDLLITLGFLAGAIFIGIIVCCCCCCCYYSKKRSTRPADGDENIFDRKREEFRRRADEWNEERLARHEHIRKKYGLMNDPDHPYSKFENE
ncbi:pituitary tumor-transforming gene 1 protein-interacting protein [Cyclopterus lumpus]|uniref:Pituitary tumor-transforming gene 1 protein-interacting protein-like n=1 Tax=Cyclopterus lumpus TaxID=8103 RepID=A0A8C2X5G5_CYCLU|nr:pituitary tumor-transforming gene 1 protein-interacting protein [Cyclopterus lumpus]